MITVYKYEISPYNNKVELFEGAEILSVAFQESTLCMWAKVNTESRTEIRIFEIYGTGHEIKHGMGIDHKFIGTAHMDNGLVFHVFESLRT